jgi:hypothetical protein
MNFGNYRPVVFIVLIPVTYAIMLRLAFGIDKWKDVLTVMSISFLFCVPAAIGVLSVYSLRPEQARNRRYQIFVPWIPVFVFLAITLISAIEGWACWLMILPFFLVSASIGGSLGAYLKFSNKKHNRLNIQLFFLLPLIISPIEMSIPITPEIYTVYTYIDVSASDAVIWRNITRVKEISNNEDTGWLTRLLGLPRPLKAEFPFPGDGASRKAIFTKGLILHEKVVEYISLRKMVFSIKAYPHEIPAATMDEHVVIGGKYFDVLNGTYILERINKSSYRVHLYSRFKLNTTFNFYAGWWASCILQDIQDNVLHIVKSRSEAMMKCP